MTVICDMDLWIVLKINMNMDYVQEEMWNFTSACEIHHSNQGPDLLTLSFLQLFIFLQFYKNNS